MKTKYISLLITSLALLVLTGCQMMPGVQFTRIETSTTIYMKAAVFHNKIICPSRVELIATNATDDQSLEVSIDSETVVVLPPHGKKKIIVPESVYTNGTVMVTGNLFRIENGKRHDSRPYQFQMWNGTPVKGWITAEGGSVYGSYQVQYSPWGY